MVADQEPSTPIMNWTLSDPILRMVFSVGIAYGSDTKTATRLMLEVAGSHPVVLKDPAPNAFFCGFGESSLDFELRAFVSDDRLPRGSSLELRWQKVSGPGEVSFDDTGSSRPRVSVTEPGSYALRLTASDGEASTERTVTVTVRAP